jgi:lipopolysaccharide transport system ATP-binding protein
MSAQVAILSEGLSKRYTIGRNRQEDTLRDALARGAERTVARAKHTIGRGPEPPERALRTIWALRDISFEIQPGEVVGIIGANGAGKSTLLKILSRITEPTAGRLGFNGRVGSLLEVGTGFHPELTGRENVLLYGSILGMRRAEVERRFDEIIEFADIGRFLDTPVKRYSSGMQVRLAFAVAAHLEPDVLVVDEVLAVGDAAFQKKCLGRMGEAAEEGRTVLFVSHNMAVIKALCQRGMLLDHGELRYDGGIDDAITLYLGDLERVITTSVAERTDRTGWEVVKLTALHIRGGADGDDVLSAGGPALFEFDLDDPHQSTSCQFTIHDDLGHPVATFMSANPAPDDIQEAAAPTRFTCAIEGLPLVPGRYRVDVEIWAQGHLQDGLQNAATFDVEPGVLAGRPVPTDGGLGNVAIEHRWRRTTT